jgi:hypothetical protein
MKNWRRYSVNAIALLAVACAMPFVAAAQDRPTLLTGVELERVVPPGFYFQGLTAPTQMRNTAAARFGTSRYVISGLVDTSGYAADIRAKYEGFFITDSPITLGGEPLGPGAYGFGFTGTGKLNILDLGGREILSVSTTKDGRMKRPRPLMMSKSGNTILFYSGKDYAVIVAK